MKLDHGSALGINCFWQSVAIPLSEHDDNRGRLCALQPNRTIDRLADVHIGYYISTLQGVSSFGSEVCSELRTCGVTGRPALVKPLVTLVWCTGGTMHKMQPPLQVSGDVVFSDGTAHVHITSYEISVANAGHTITRCADA
jgi:hypothetical protein